MRCSNVYQQKIFTIVSSATLKICWKISTISERPFAKVWGLRFGVDNFFLFMRCSNVYEQKKLGNV